MNAFRIASLVFLGTSALGAPVAAGPSATQPPVKLEISVTPAAVAPGSTAAATVKLVPNPGIKLNKYPKIKMQIPATPGLVDATEGAIGNAGPPPADDLDANYFHGEVDPLVVRFHVDPSAARGKHDVAAKVSYFYCVASSGYCAPAKVDVVLPVNVR